MLEIFSPAVNLINRFRYSQKLTLLGAIMIAVVAILMIEITIRMFSQIEFSKVELKGLELNTPLVNLLRKIQSYRVLNIALRGNLATEEELHTAELSVEQAITEINHLVGNSFHDLEMLEDWEQIKSQWNVLKTSKDVESAVKVPDIYPYIQKLITIISDKYNLTRDPSVDAFCLVDTYSRLMPRFIQRIKKMQAMGLYMLEFKDAPEASLETVHMLSIEANFLLVLINDFIGRATSNNPAVEEQLSNSQRLVNQHTDNLIKMVNNTILSKKFGYSLTEYNDKFEEIEINIDQLSDNMLATIRTLIVGRIKFYYKVFFYNAIMVLTGAAILVYLFVGVYLSIMQSVRRLAYGSEQISKGNLKSKVQLNSQDELSQVADSFNKMREILLNLVSELQQVSSAIAQGNLNERVTLDNKEGFSKELSVNINTMTDVFQGLIKDITTVLDFLGKGNLTIRLTKPYQGVFAQLQSYVNDTIDVFESLIKSIQITSETVNNAMNEISLGSRDLEKRTEQQAASLEETSMSMGKITEIVKENAEHIQSAHNHMQITSNIALESGTVVNQVIGMMNSINESAKSITDITDVIDNIAFQTNILALNAAVEAARAGEQGRGFSVVASEIRNLAQRSSTSAQGIKTLIHSSVEQVMEGKKLADEAGKTMNRVVDSIKQITGVMSEIADSSAQQTNGIQQINIAINQMDQVTQQNSALVEEATRASEALQKQSEKMNKLVKVFKIRSGEQNKQLSYDEVRDLKNESFDSKVSEEKRDRNKKDKNKKPARDAEPPTESNPDEWTEF